MKNNKTREMKFLRWSLFLILILIMVIPIISAWPYGFSYRKLINISNTAGELTDFQVAINLTEMDLNLSGLVGSWHFNEGLSASCQDIKTWNPDAADGVYEIHPNDASFEVYCDMTTDGGGWMLLDNFVSSIGGDTDPYGYAIGYSNIKGAAGLATADYEVYLTNYESPSYHSEAGYLQMFYSGAPYGFINKTLPTYANEVYVKWGNWYGGTATLAIGGSVVQTLTADYGAATYQGNYNLGDNIRFQESGIFWAGEVWVRGPGATKDASGSENDGDVYGTIRTDGVEGYGLEFDGDDDYVDMGFDSSMDSCSIAVATWVKPADSGPASETDRIVSRDRSDYWMLGQDTNNGIEWTIYEGSMRQYFSSTNVMAAGNWSFVVGTYDGSTGVMKAYVDGIEVISETPTTCTGVLGLGTDRPLAVGTNVEAAPMGTYCFNGTLDEVRIYNRALSSTEINKSFCIGAYRLNQTETFDYPSWCDDYIKSKYYSWQDLRFTNASGGELKSGTTFSHWLESDKKAWVKVPLLVNDANTTIYANYGVTSMSSESSVDNTFTKDYGESGLTGLWHMDEVNLTSIDSSMYWDYDSFESPPPGGNDTWSARNWQVPVITSSTSYTGTYSLHMDTTDGGWGRNFETTTGLEDGQTSAGYDTNTYPYMCMAYKIPAATTNNMLIRVNAVWYSITMTAGENPTSYPKAASWNPLTADNTWYHKCINLDSQLDSSLGAGTHTITAVIWHGDTGFTPEGLHGYGIEGEFWIDDFIISKESIAPTFITDSSGNGNNGFMHGASTWVGSDGGQWDGRSDVTFATGDSLEFDGAGYVDIPSGSVPTGNEITISFWAYGADAQPVNNYVITDTTGSDGYTINVHLPWGTGTVYWDCGNDGTYDRISKAASASDYKGRWTHWAFTKDAVAGEMKIYMNGTLWHSGVGKTKSLPVSPSPQIGTSYRGKLDEFRIYNRTLSADEIKTYYERRKYATPEPDMSFMGTEEERPAHRNPFIVSFSSHLKFSGSGFGFKIRSPVIA